MLDSAVESRPYVDDKYLLMQIIINYIQQFRYTGGNKLCIKYKQRAENIIACPTAVNISEPIATSIVINRYSNN